MKGAGPMGWLAGSLQALGAFGLAVGLFLALPLGWALLTVGALACVGGVVLEIGQRPRQVVAPVVEHPTAHAWMRGPRAGEQSGR